MLAIQDRHNLHKLLSRFSLEHLEPPPEIFRIRFSQRELVSELQNGKKIRRIFHQVPYFQEEETAISQVQRLMDEKGLQQSFFPRETILKHLYDASMKASECLDRLEKTYQFLNCEEITSFTAETLKKLEHGIIYTFGRDKQMKPIVVIRMDRIDLTCTLPQIFNSIYYLMLVVQGIRAVPYHAEKYTCIFDFSGLNLTSMPFRTLVGILEKLSLCYCGCVSKTFLYDLKGVQTFWNLIKGLIPEHARGTIFPLSADDRAKFNEFIDGSQLEERYGGAIPNLGRYWPPSTPEAMAKSKENQSSDEEAFYSIKNADETRKASPECSDEDYHTVDSRGIRETREREKQSVSCHCALF